MDHAEFVISITSWQVLNMSRYSRKLFYLCRIETRTWFSCRWDNHGNFKFRYELSFLKDTEKINTSEITRSWLECHPEVKFLDWPTDDINPMKGVWDLMRRRLEYDFPLHDPFLIYNCWQDLKENPDYFEDIYHSMDRHIQRIILKCGDFNFDS